MKRRWTNDEAKIAIDFHNAGYSYDLIGDLLNRNGKSVRNKLARLKVRKKNVRNSYARWSDTDRGLLEDLIEEGKTNEFIAKRLNRTVLSIKRQRNIRGINYNKYTIRGIARLMGVHHGVVMWWVKTKALKSVKNGVYTFIDYEDLTSFLEDERHWPKWNVDTITSDELKEWASELRKDKEFLTVKEAGKIIGFSKFGVHTRIYNGKLKAVRSQGSRFVIRKDWLDEYMQRYECS